MKRGIDVVAVALLVVTLLTWMVALVTAKPAQTPSVVVVGEPLLPRGTPIALRVSAAMPNATKKSVVTGDVTARAPSGPGASWRAPLVDGTARLPAQIGDAAVTDALDLVVDGVVDVHATVEQRPTSLRLGPPKLMYESWSAEVQMVSPPSPGHAASKAPIYPVDGRVSGRLKSRALVLDENDKPTSIDVEPAVGGARLDDGRVLRVDRTGLRIEIPLEVDAGKTIPVVIETSEKQDVGLDLVVDGVVHDSKNIAVDKHATVDLQTGDARPGDVVVVHAGGVWPDDLGRFAIARIRDPATPLATFIDGVARTAGCPPDEPLANWLRAHPDDVDAQRALLQRLHPAKLRAPKLQVTFASTAATGHLWFLAYSALSGLCVLLVAALGLVRMRDRRGLALVGALALGVLLAGLDAVLVVLARG